jgi:hypothetical protein
LQFARVGDEIVLPCRIDNQRGIVQWTRSLSLVLLVLITVFISVIVIILLLFIYKRVKRFSHLDGPDPVNENF